MVADQIAAIVRARLHGRYFEPFLGGGAVFFALAPHPATLSDSNQDLIETYIEVRDHLATVIRALRKHVAEHSREHYYQVRRALPRTAAARAARVIYLNHTCFNGLWRVNSKGEFNVPIGSYKTPKILDEDRLSAASKALAGACIKAVGFQELLSDSENGPREGDVVYADPPYDPLSKTANFTSYTRSEFGEDQQVALAAILTTLAKRGVTVVASNSDTSLIKREYPRDVFTRTTVMVPRAINSVGARRGRVPELLLVSRQG